MFQFQEETSFQIKFLGDFEFEGYGCKYDFIEIRNGDTKDAPLVVKACGDVKPKVPTLIGSSVWIKFKSDGSGNKKGFSLKVTKLSRSEGRL